MLLHVSQAATPSTPSQSKTRPPRSLDPDAAYFPLKTVVSAASAASPRGFCHRSPYLPQKTRSPVLGSPTICHARSALRLCVLFSYSDKGSNIGHRTVCSECNSSHRSIGPPDPPQNITKPNRRSLQAPTTTFQRSRHRRDTHCPDHCGRMHKMYNDEVPQTNAKAPAGALLHSLPQSSSSAAPRRRSFLSSAFGHGRSRSAEIRDSPPPSYDSIQAPPSNKLTKFAPPGCTCSSCFFGWSKLVSSDYSAQGDANNRSHRLSRTPSTSCASTTPLSSWTTRGPWCSLARRRDEHDGLRYRLRCKAGKALLLPTGRRSP